MAHTGLELVAVLHVVISFHKRNRTGNSHNSADETKELNYLLAPLTDMLKRARVRQRVGRRVGCMYRDLEIGLAQDSQPIGSYFELAWGKHCLLYTSPSPRDQRGSRMPSSA